MTCGFHWSKGAFMHTNEVNDPQAGLLVEKLEETYGSRLLLVLQGGVWFQLQDGSAGKSIRIILDKVQPEDSLQLQQVLATIAWGHAAAVWLESLEELRFLPREEFVPYYYGCRIIHGQAEEIIPSVSRQEIFEYAMQMLIIFNRAVRKAWLDYSVSPAGDLAGRKLLELALPVLEAWHLLAHGEYIQTIEALLTRDIAVEDRLVFGSANNSLSPEDQLFCLEKWSRDIFQRISILPSTDMLHDPRQSNAELMDKNAVLRNLAITDELTGLHNRYYFDQRINEEIERSDRYGNPLTLIMFDLDHFKNVNDIWGHDAGDKVLVAVAAAIREKIRKPDIFARWGGEEFMIAPLQTDLPGAVRLAEKLRQALADLQHPEVGQVTASFGLACRMPDESYESWFRRTDQALYQAKSQGRNCVSASESSDDLPSAQIRLDWNPVWECGNRIIDTQHKHVMMLANNLIGLAMNLADPKEIEPQLQNLVSEIIHHFSDEERILALINFPDTVPHAERHKNLIIKLKRLRDGYLRGRLKTSVFFVFIVEEVIVGHILVDDVLYFPYIRDLPEKT